MSAIDRERVKELLSQASRLPRAERAAFIRHAATDDPRTAAEAIDLLPTLDDSAFMGAPTGGGLLAALPPSEVVGESPGTSIDRYKLLQLIGEGGFGSVFMAEQTEPVHRKVALKIIKAGMDTRQVIARFEAERQALALMDHPNIARVLDAGATHSGRPYFVMELVRGEPITKYCDRERLSIEQRLRLLCDVCHAVQHAHQKGIIHRDLKPSNVLVTVANGQPLPKVIDFGIAKATAAKLTDKTLFTELHQLIGTPEYMSPEQAELSGVDIDTRSDVYSLGVLLYELLSGSTPLERGRLHSTPMAEIQRLIREEEPPRPSLRFRTLDGTSRERGSGGPREGLPATDRSSAIEIARLRRTEPLLLARALRGDLDWIVMKCLEKDRRRRYETASSLAHDIERYLVHEPVLATPPRPGYKLRKFIRRNRTIVVAGGLIAAVLAVGMVGTAGGLVWALRERERADAQKRIAEGNAEAARQEAERANRESLAALDARALAEARAEETLKVADFQAQMLRGLNAESLGNGIREKFREQARAALARQPIGDWPHRQTRTPEEVDQELRTFDEVSNVVAMADVARHVMDDFLLARASKAVAEQFRDQPLVQAEIHNSLGASYRALALFEAAEAEFRMALALHREALGDHPAVARDLNNVATVLYDRGEYASAEPLCLEALAIQQGQLGDEHVDIVQTLHNLGTLAEVRGDHVKAEEYLRNALEMGLKLLGPNHVEVLDAMAGLAGLMYERGRLAESESMYRELLTLYREAHGNEHPKVASMLHNLGGVLRSKGDLDGAEQANRGALAMRRNLLGQQHPNVATTLCNLGLVLKNKSQWEEAEALYRECLEIRRKVLGDDNVDVAGTINNLAVLLRDRGDYAAAEPVYREAIAILERKLPSGHAQTASARTGLARVLVKLSQDAALSAADRDARLVEAEALLETAKRDLSADPNAPSIFKKRVDEGLIELYELRHAGSPEDGYDAKLAALRAGQDAALSKP